MTKMSTLMALVILLCSGISHGAERDLKTITTIMDAYEKQIDSVRMRYTYATFAMDKEGNREFVKGVFARKETEGFVLLDETAQRGRTWDNDKEPTGIARSYNGQVPRYFEHEKNKRGHHMSALFMEHNPQLYKTRENAYYHVWYLNYKHKFTDLLNDPNGAARIQGEETVDGLKAIKIDFRSAKGLFDCHLWLSPEMNYLPVRYESYRTTDGGREQEVRWSEFKEFDGRVWYPMRIEQYLKDIKEPVTVTIEEMSISPLTQEDFEFEFPASTHVTDHILGASYLTTMPLEQSDIERASLESSLSDKDRETVLDDYLASGATINGKGSDVTAGSKIAAQRDLSETSKRVPYRALILVAVVMAGGVIAVVLTRRKQA